MTGTSNTVFYIKNSLGQYLEYNTFTGLRLWVDMYSEACAFESENAAMLYCRSLIADCKVHGTELTIDVYKQTNQTTPLNVNIPEDQNRMYGLNKE